MDTELVCQRPTESPIEMYQGQSSKLLISSIHKVFQWLRLLDKATRLRLGIE
jgi:hypothetical protein